MIETLDIGLIKRNWDKLNKDDQEFVNDYFKDNRIFFYAPHTKQAQFHNSLARTRAIFGGNRSGKTYAGSAEFVMHMTRKYPQWYEGIRYDHPIKGRVVAKDFQKGVGEVVEPAIRMWLSKHDIKRSHKNPQGLVTKYELKSGNSFDIMTHEQDTTQFEGWAGDIIWFDEPPPRDKYVASLRGLVDTYGRCMLTLTPLTQPWIYDEIYTSHDRNIFCITVDMRDNPHLSERAIKDYEKELTDDEREARIHGKFLHLQGLVYKEFNHAVHVIPAKSLQGPIYFSIDPHDRTPTKMIWAQVDETNDVFIIQELSCQDTIENISKAIQKLETNLRITPQIRFIDPNYGQKKLNIVTGRTIKEEFERHNIKMVLANDDITAGHLKVKEYLKYDKTRPIDLDNRPKLYIFNDCREVIKGMTHYIWDEWKNEGERDKKEKPRDIFKHFPDCIRYLLMANPRYSAPSLYRPKMDLYGTS